MIMAALHTVNHNILSPTRYQLLRQIKSGSEGQDDVAQMLGILNEVEHRPVALGRVLDLGCASGRMLRFLPREETSEHWGLDINAAHIEWCQQNLNPPMLFATQHHRIFHLKITYSICSTADQSSRIYPNWLRLGSSKFGEFSGRVCLICLPYTRARGFS
jgi:SAM-dependent methyltransferase